MYFVVLKTTFEIHFEEEEGITHAEETVKDNKQVKKGFRPLVQDENYQGYICPKYQTKSNKNSHPHPGQN